MAEGNGGGGGSNRDASRPRARVQQLRPTNKEAVISAPPSAVQVSTSEAESSKGTTTAAATINAATTTPVSAQPRVVVPRIVTGQGSGSTILVNNCQRGNPILQHIRNIGWEYGDIVPDYQVGVASCILFLSLRYHRLHPEYIHSRIQKMGHMYTLRILLVMCDVDDSQSAIKELVKVALVNSLTLMVAWTPEEAGSYVERYKSFENKAPDLIRERVNNDYMSHLNSALTNIKGINKTDVITLATNFGSFKRIAEASSEDLSQCPGFGATKVKRLKDVFSQPFRVGETRSGRERRAERQRLHGSTTTNNNNGAPLKGRFVDDDEDEVLQQFRQHGDKALDLESLPNRPAVTNPSSYVAPKSSNGTAVRDTDHEELDDDVENADDWDILDGMTEEEATLLALEMSKTG